MRLSKVTLFGFKSFADKIEFRFGSGITAIVGPNGAGKTNFLEAVRWVLGEQSAKLLRGDRMEDVIFKGGGKRKPLSMAEVSLTLTENRGELPIEYEEVTIARRIFRSGESEYLLNKVPCRLRDIADLFLDGGLGAEPYALIDQGLITFLVGAKPKDLKALLEEAAGIMKYKTRKKAALSKLEATEQNLLRIRDIIQEVERQLQSLKRQAQKAIRYKTLEERSLHLKLYLKFREGLSSQGELKRTRTEKANFEEALTAKEAAIARLEAVLEEARLRDLEQEKALASAQETLYTLKSHLAQGEAEVSSHRSFLQELSRQIDENKHLLQRTLERQRLLEGEMAEKRSALKQLEEGLLIKEQELQQLEADLRNVEEKLKGADQAFAAYRQAAVEHALALAKRRNHLLSLKERQRLLLREKGRILAKLEELRSKAEAASQEERVLKEVIERAAMEREALQGEREALLQQSFEAGEQLQAIGFRIQGVREEAALLQSWLAALQAFDDQAPPEERALSAPELSSLQAFNPKGYLFEALEVDPKYERAVEALLGEALRGLVVPSLEEALQALAFLKGRETRAPLLFPLPQGRERAQRLREALKAAGVEIEGLAVDLVRAKGLDGALLDTLLGDGVIVKDLEDATALASTLPVPFIITTLEGEVLSCRGTLTGGTPSSSGPLLRKRQILELKGTLEPKEAERATLEEEERVQKSRLEEMAQALEALKAQIAEVELRRQGAEKDLLRCQAEKERLDREQDLLLYEGKTLEEELTPLEQELKNVERKAQAAEGEEERLETEGRSLEERKAALERRWKEHQEEYLAKKVELTVTLERREGFRRDWERLEEEFRTLHAEANRLQGELEALEVRKKALEDTIKDRQETLQVLAQQERVQQEALRRDEETRRAIKERIKNLEEELKPLRREAFELRGELSSRSAKEAELQNALLRLEEDLREYSITFQELQGRFQEELDPVEVEKELQEVKAKLQSLGPVNLAALEEHEALSERHRFLTAQAADLEASMRTLKNTIAEIEKTIKRLFQETLASVNQHFDRLWQCLFGGGGAALRLTEPDDPMNRGLKEDGDEPGLEMILQLPGRRKTPSSFLSGGERSLAALALLLALFEVKPSPFCILDEVDAPLDDANVERFVTLLQELSARHQFIVITHNKKTMGAAEVLYGLTIEDGASKLISVKLKDPA